MEEIKIKRNSLSGRMYEEVELDSKRDLQPILDWIYEYKKKYPKNEFQGLNFKFLQETNCIYNGAVVSSVPPYGCRPYLEAWEDEIELCDNQPRPLKNGWYIMTNDKLHFFLCRKEDTILFITF